MTDNIDKVLFLCTSYLARSITPSVNTVVSLPLAMLEKNAIQQEINPIGATPV